MKLNWVSVGLVAVLLAGCEKQEEEAPKATIEVEEEAPVELPEEVAIEPQTPQAPPAPPALEPEESPTVGERVDRAIEATESGLQTAGDKTREGVATATEKTGEALQTAGEKTEEGVRKGAEATGRFLREVGERLEGVATGEELEEPVQPVEP